MTENQFKTKYEKMLPDVIDHLRKKGLSLFRSGGVDTESYEDDFTLPKIVLGAALDDCKWQYQPVDKESRKISDNLTHF